MLLREYPTLKQAEDEAERLDALLDSVLQAGRKFDCKDLTGDALIAARNAVYAAVPAWATLNAEFPDFFTTPDDVGLCAYWPTIDAEEGLI